MAPNLSKLLTRNNALSAAAVASLLWYLNTTKRLNFNKGDRRKIKKKVDEDVKYLISEKTTTPSTKAVVDRKFFSRLFQLLKIIIPGWTSPESGLLFLVAGSLIARSLCDLWMISNGTKIESAIIAMNRNLFQKRLFQFLLAMPLVALVNNVLKFSVGELKIRLRNNMTRRLYDEYLRHFTYYRITNLDNRIANADQLLTTDIDKFCESVADLYCNVAKPSLDIGIYVYRLTTSLGGGTPSIMLCYLVISGFLLTYLRRPTGRLTATEQKLEGEFRHINARLITHSEEIAFYQGNNREKATLISSFNKLLAHLRKFLKFRVFMGIFDNMIAKYFATVIGFWAVSLPFVSHRSMSSYDQGERSRLYYTYGRMLVKLAEAIGRLVLAGRELTRLAGFTTRVTQLRQVLADLNEGKYQRTMLAGTENLKLNSGKLIFKDNIIKFDRVPVITPNGDVLIKELSVEIHSGMNVLVCGPNGAGKSSVFRILGELWPLFGGELTKPPRGKLFYIPQKPYMTLGSLRDQITYPHSSSEALRRGNTDDKLVQHMQRVQLEYLLEREGGLDAVADWLDVLSGGEKQRIAMARLFYHAPQFAILDECTSAVSVDVEGSMYSYCRQVGITLLTVSHRKSLWQHHEYVLHLDGRGSYTFKTIDSSVEQFGS